MFGKCRHVGLQTGKYHTQIASMDLILGLVVTQFLFNILLQYVNGKKT